MKTKKEGILWTAKQVSDYLGISEKTAYYLLSSNIINSINLSPEKQWRTTKEAVDLWLKNTLKYK